MRLWHKYLIKGLPRKQLLSQWRECCCIARNISVNGTPNHLLVNKVLNYPMSHFYSYGLYVYEEMLRRGYNVDFTKFSHYFTYPYECSIISVDDIFPAWHNEVYLIQCYYNLQEKHDCGGLTDTEWEAIEGAKCAGIKACIK